MSDGWDHPPVVASPASVDERSKNRWNARSCHWKTPQRVFSLDSKLEHEHQPEGFSAGNSCCAPIIIQNMYVVLANDMSISLYGNFENEIEHDINTTTTTPSLAHLSLSLDDDDGNKIGSLACGVGGIVQMIFHEETSIIYLLTTESCIFQVKFVDQPTKNQKWFHLMNNFFTKKLGASCFATLHDGGGKGVDTICVGYKSGYIETWNIHAVHSFPREKIAHRTLLWEGYTNHAIRTLSFLLRRNPNDIRKDNTEFREILEDFFLIAIVSINTRTVDKEKQLTTTSSMLKILDLKRIIIDRRKSDIPLENYLLPQPQGMELIDATTIPVSEDCAVPKRVPILESHGADAACILNSARLGIAFPDGVTSFLSSSQNVVNTIEIPEENHQVLLSYPAIGNGKLDIIDKDGKSSRYLATCLRGGTCYLIPVSNESKSNGNDSIATISFPHDVQSDLSDIYVQSFTAGNLMVGGSLLPILIYVWPGGVVDFYACGLIYSKPTKGVALLAGDDTHDPFVSRVRLNALQDLIDNESFLLLSSILDELKSDSQHPLLQRKEWQQILQETKRDRKLPVSVDKITFDTLCSSQYQNFCDLLLSLARVNE